MWWTPTVVLALLYVEYHGRPLGYRDAPKPEGSVDNPSTRGIPVSITYLDTTISHPIHWDPFMHIYFRKLCKFIKTIHKSSSYNSLIYKILHVKSFFFFYKKVSQSHGSTFFTPTVSDEGQPPVHNLHLKGGPTTG